MEMNAVHVSLAEEPGQGVPEVDVPGDGPGAGDLHPAGAGDQLDRARRGALAHRRRDAGLRRGLRQLRLAVADPDRRHHAGHRLPRRHAHLAGRTVQGPAADLPAGGLPAAVPAAAQQERRPAEHPGRPGPGHHRDRPRLRADPGRLQRLLDLLGDHHAGLPDHVPADVRGRDPAAPQAIPTTRAATGPRCSSGMCGVGFAASLAALLVGFIPPSQFESRQLRRLLPDRRRRRPGPRPARAVPLLPVPQALLEAA